MCCVAVAAQGRAKRWHWLFHADAASTSLVIICRFLHRISSRTALCVVVCKPAVRCHHHLIVLVVIAPFVATDPRHAGGGGDARRGPGGAAGPRRGGPPHRRRPPAPRGPARPLHPRTPGTCTARMAPTTTTMTFTTTTRSMMVLEEARIGSAPNKIDTQDPDPRRRSDAAAVPAQLAASMRKKVRRFYRTGVDAVRQLAGAQLAVSMRRRDSPLLSDRA